MRFSSKWSGFGTGLFGLLLSGAALCAGQTLTDSRLTVETVVAGGTGLSQPTVMAFIGDNDFLICQKGNGQVKRYTNGAFVSTVLDLPVNASSERGLLGIALHPDFPTLPFVYLYYSRAAADNGTWIENRVSRFVWTGTALTSETLIVAFPNDATQSNGPNHDGGIILFGPDGKLYGVTGDLNRSRLEQNQGTGSTASGVGGVFRLNDDGTIPSDNPFIGDTRPEIQRLFGYGVRNSYGMTFDPLTGKLWETENGPTLMDEINLIEGGFNGGWSDIMGPDSRDPQGVADLVMIPGAFYSDPEFSWSTPVAVTSIRFLHTPLFPCDLQDKVLVGDNNFGQLYLFEPNATRDGFVLTGGLADLVADSTAERNQTRIGTGWGVVTDIVIGPDRMVYVVDLVGGKVLRIRPVRPIGDMNGDNVVDNFDLDAFILALLDPGAYALAYPGIDPNVTGDINCDGTLDFFDIDPFIALLLG